MQITLLHGYYPCKLLFLVLILCPDNHFPFLRKHTWHFKKPGKGVV